MEQTQSQKPKILWYDLTAGTRHAELPEALSEAVQSIHCVTHQQAVAHCAAGRVDAVILDFDYPDRRGLRTLQNLKVAFQQLPMFMLTLQHSEELAVWSFRSGMRDYLVKPVARYEVERLIDTLQSISSQRVNQSHRQASMRVAMIPPGAAAPIAAKQHTTNLALAINYIEKHFRSKIRVEEMANLCGMSPFRFSRAFRANFGITLQNYLSQFRLTEACRMLANPNAVVSDVCYAVGFNDTSYFTRVFRKQYNVVPSAIIGSLELQETSSLPDPVASRKGDVPDVASDA